MNSPCVLAFLVFFVVCVDPSLGFLRICATKDQDALCKALEASSTNYKCVTVEDRVDCLYKLQNNRTDFGSFSAAEALLAAEEPAQSQLRIAAEIRNKQKIENAFDFQTVVVVRSTYTGGFEELKGKGYCREAAKWSSSVLKAFERKASISTAVNKDALTSIVESELVSVSNYFSASCLPGTWTTNQYLNEQYQGKKYNKLCQLCPNSQCITDETYSAMACLKNQADNVVYTSLDKVRNFFKQSTDLSQDDFRFLCKDGTVQLVSTASPCTWVQQPWRTVLTTEDKVRQVIDSLTQIGVRSSVSPQEQLAHILSYSESEQIVTSPYGYKPVSDYVYLGREKAAVSQNEIKVCTTSELAQEKCKLLSRAARIEGIVPTFLCNVPAPNVTKCLQHVNQSDADVAIISTESGFIARSAYKLKPVMYEEGTNYFGVIAVNATNSSIKSIADLKGMKACFPEFSGLGYLNYLNSAINAKKLPKATCPTYQDSLTYFGDSCAPGINDLAINKDKISSHSLCKACKPEHCQANKRNDYFGETGAVRCLLDGAGQVAFVNLRELKNLHRNRTSALGHQLNNVKVLCQDSTLQNITHANIDTCPSLAVVGSEIVRRGNIESGRLIDMQLAFEEINTLFSARKAPRIVSLFGKFKGEENVLFSSEGTEIVNAIKPSGTFAEKYHSVQEIFGHCSSASTFAISSLLTFFVSLAFYFMF